MAIKRSKLAYFKSAEIQAKINDGSLDEYDLVYCPDTREIVMLDSHKVPHVSKSRFDVYPNETMANATINTLSYTYAGQIVMIDTNEDGLKPYVVNLNASNQYYVVPANSGHSQAIVDYNLAENIPIINIVADEEIILADLADGYYSIIGSYRISNTDPTHKMTAKRIVFCISHETDSHGQSVIEITEFKGSGIKLYTVTQSETIEDRYVKLSEFDSMAKEYVDDNVDENISDYIDNNVASKADINSLFD